MQTSIDVLRSLLEITIYSAAIFAAIMVFKTINNFQPATAAGD
ncbi:MAG: hypothetical protein WCP73_06930 [Eubacteriales bacterium]